MPKRNSNPKNPAPSLRERCWARRMSVTDLAARIGRNRSTCYFAWQNPSKFPLAYKLIQKALTE
jgi:hypothetical protein